MNQTASTAHAPASPVSADERLKLAMEVSGIATWEFEYATQHLTYSDNFPEVFGCESGRQYTRLQLRELVHPEDLALIVNPAFERAQATGLYTFEARVNSTDLNTRWVKITGKVIYNEQSQPQRLVGTVLNITAQKEASDHSAQLAAIVNSSNDAIISNRLDGTILTWNKSAERILGYTEEEIVGASILTIFPEDRVLEEEGIIARINNGEHIDHFETRRKRKDGSLVDLSLCLSPIRDSEGRIVGVSKIARDITRQKQAERLIRENEERLELVMEASGIGMWELNLQTRAISFSRTYLDMVGYESGEHLTPEILVKHIHPDDKPLRDQAFEKAMVTGHLEYIFRMIRVDKTERWIEVKGRAFRDEQDRPLRLLGTIRDITEEKENIELLKESEQKFRLLADSMPQFVWTSDASGHLDYFNRSVYQYSGYAEEEITGEGWLRIVHPHDREDNVRRWQHAVQTGEPFLCEHRFRRYDGEFRWQLSRAVPQKDEYGVIQRWVGTSTDVHDQKTFAEELEQSVSMRTAELKSAVEALTRMNQDLEQFAYVSSHDLQEPLRKIQTFVGLLNHNLRADPDKSAMYLNKIGGAAHRMSELIKDLLEYSRLRKDEQQSRTVDLNATVQRVLEDYEITIADKQAEIILSGQLPAVQANPLQMSQLFFNLIGNALKFCERRPVIRITAEVITPGEELVRAGLSPLREYHKICVIDNGIGFSREYADRIFTIFQRLNTRDKYEGTGIGLAICKKITDNHLGLIMADSEENKGSVFSVYLPR